jgi:hypothetical protein
MRTMTSAKWLCKRKSIAATILKSPQQCGQWVRSKLNGSWQSFAATVAVNDFVPFGICGTTFERHFAFGAKTLCHHPMNHPLLKSLRLALTA